MHVKPILLLGLLLAGCSSAPQGLPPPSDVVAPHLDDLSVESLETAAVDLVASGPHWAMMVLTIDPDELEALGGLVQLGYSVATTGDTSASLMIAAQTEHGPDHDVVLSFQAVPENSSSTLGAQGMSTTDRGASVQVAIALAAHGPGRAALRLGLVAPQDLDKRWEGLPMILARPATTVVPDFVGDGLQAGTYWMLRDTEGLRIEYAQAIHCSDSNLVQNIGGTQDCDASTTIGDGIAGVDYRALWQTGAWEWEANVTGTDLYKDQTSATASSIIAPANIVLVTPSAVTDRWGERWHWQGPVQAGPLAIRLHRQMAANLTLETIRDPTTGATREEQEILSWGYFGGDLSALLGWPPTEFGSKGRGIQRDMFPLAPEAA